MVHACFNIRLGGAWLPAPAAQWVADLDAARATARTIVQGLMRQHGGDPRLLDAALVITDDDGRTLLEQTFREALYLPVEPVTDPYRRRPAAKTAGGLRAPRALLSAALRPIRRLAAARIPS
ncbi:catalase [Methylobacterium sp. NEAU K]|uniref:DUF6894 family protein n=1 Tax=Methylobacterium sp. NEAU K TaxID=3064946 RepID=UPI002732B124|nr:catalase [Methylobacterium sp. NEAU K]MDP4004323.1 catalase [Methylobacterium sp. NEAU K]